MQGFRFYAEMPEARKSKRATKDFPVPFTRDGIRRAVKAGNRFNVSAVFTGREHRMVDGYEAVAAVFEHGGSAVASTGVSFDFLRTRCVNIDEPTARKSHPELFKVLDSNA